jgi:hypothetical protein
MLRSSSARIIHTRGARTYYTAMGYRKFEPDGISEKDLFHCICTNLTCKCKATDIANGWSIGFDGERKYNITRISSNRNYRTTHSISSDDGKGLRCQPIPRGFELVPRTRSRTSFFELLSINFKFFSRGQRPFRLNSRRRLVRARPVNFSASGS